MFRLYQVRNNILFEEKGARKLKFKRTTRSSTWNIYFGGF